MIDYLRDEYFNNNQSTPNTRAIIKAMGERWGEKIDQKALYDLFPLDPPKQGGQSRVCRRASARAATEPRGRAANPGIANEGKRVVRL